MEINGFIPRRTLLIFAIVILLSSGVCGILETVEDGPLRWKTVSDDAALCNDFTKAGFFHRNTTKNGAGKWIVFLESGAVCYSNETCNRRYFNSAVRNEYSKNRLDNSGYGDFDTSAAFSKWRHYAGTDYVNPLMTSMRCFNNTTFFPEDLQIDGKDIFDRSADSTKHVFSDHGQVIIPYCSSDVWLGDEDGETRAFPQKLGNTSTPCECFDQECFQYNPTAPGLQFTFRGKTIFRAVMRELNDIYNLRDASELVLIGSSAGGVGAINLVKWVKEEYPNLELKVIVDSAWFINFRDGINEQFTNLQNSVGVVSNEPTTPPATSVPYSPSSTLSSLSPSPSHTMSDLDPTTIFATPTPLVIDYPDYSGSGSAASGSTSGSGSASESGSDSGSGSGSAWSESGSTSGSGSASESGSDSGSGSGSAWSESGSTSGSESGSGDFGSTSSEQVIKRSVKEDTDRENNERYRRDVTTENDLLFLLKSHEACYDTHRGYPCCLSAQCVLSSSSPETNEPYFPSDVSLLVITSLYDVFILSQALKEVEVFQSDTDNTPIGRYITYLDSFFR